MNSGKWFWTEAWNEEADNSARLVLFRTEIDGPVRETSLSITADTRYKLYINGRHVQSGPSKGDDRIRFIDEADISRYLNDDHNVIAVAVLKYPYGDPEHSNHSLFTSEMPGLYIAGFEPEAYGSAWRSHVCRTTVFDGEEEGFAPLHIHERTETDPLAAGWKDPRSDDSSWNGVFTYDDDSVPEILRRENLAARTIPYMRMTEGRFIACSDSSWMDVIRGTGELTIPANSQIEVTLDAGEEMTAFPVMKLSGGAGAEVEVLYSECYVIPDENGTHKDNRCDSENGILTGYADTMRITAAGDWEYEPYWFRTFRFVSIIIRTGESPLTIRSLAYEETGYPLDVRTSVSTSDKSLEAVWDISLRTLKRCMHDTYMDCPFYEQLQYVMDTRAQILYTYSVAADDRLARKAIDDFTRSQREDGLLNACYPNRNANVIPGFSMFYILILHDHMMYFGDRELIAGCMPSVDRALGFFGSHIGDDGLVGQIGGVNGEARYWSFVDWAEEWMDTVGMPPAALRGPDTLQNLIYVMGLQAAADLAEYTGDADAADRYEERAEAVKAAVRRLCTNEEGLITDGPDTDELSQHAQVLGALTGLYNEEESRRAMMECMTRGGFTRCSVAWNFYLFRALEETGLYQLTDKCWDTWRNMVANGCTTCVEAEKYSRSECHAWGALALYELPSTVLGVRPAAPGYEEIMVKPVVGYMTHAEGTVHTPHGDIRVEWQRKDDATGGIDLSIGCDDTLKRRILKK